MTLGGAKPKNGPGCQGHEGQFGGPEEALEGLFLAGDQDVGGEEAGEQLVRWSVGLPEAIFQAKVGGEGLGFIPAGAAALENELPRGT